MCFCLCVQCGNKTHFIFLKKWCLQSACVLWSEGVARFFFSKIGLLEYGYFIQAIRVHHINHKMLFQHYFCLF